MAATTTATTTQATIAAALGVTAPERFHAATEVRRRTRFLADYLRATGATGYVLGISGGVDSTTAGCLAQLACAEVGATFTAVRLPYGTQADEADAQAALAFIEPGEQVTVDIQGATDAMTQAALSVSGPLDPAAADFLKGNIKARQRMIAQYALAGARGALVIGTDHAAEAVMGFFTKHGDGACDLTPLAGLTKGQVRAVATELRVPATLVHKTPTADLEDDRPGLPDEAAHGCSYADIDAYLEGRPVAAAAAARIEAAYRATAHKRALPAAP